MTPSVDVVIVAYRSAGQLDRLVPSLTTSDAVGQVVVVDHGDDDSAGVAERLGAIGVREPANPGFGAGQNRGREMTTSPLVLALNPDLDVDIDAVVRSGPLFDDPAVGAVQGVVINAISGRAERSAGIELTHVHLWGRAIHLRSALRIGPVRWFARRTRLLRDHVDRVPDAPLDVETLASTATLFRRTALDSVGGYDETFFLYGEDLDLCRRLRASGWRLLALPDAWCVHESGGTSSDGWSRELRWWEGTMRFAAIHWATPAFASALAAAVMRATVLALRRPRSVTLPFGAIVAGPWRVRRRSGLSARRPPSPI